LIIILITKAFTVGLYNQFNHLLTMGIAFVIAIGLGLGGCLPWVSHAILLEFALGFVLLWQEKSAPAISC
jgi:hypothetical protein